MKYFYCIFSLLITLSARTQISDDFSDGDFINAPAWSGNDSEFIVNASGQLQLNASVAGDSYLSLPHNLTDLNDKEWRFYVKQTFSPSGSNFGRIYLSAASADLTSDPDGFFLQLGEAGSGDAIRLIKSVGGSQTEIFAGSSGQIASSFTLSIRVVRDNSGLWSLYVDPAAGDNFSFVNSGTDAATFGTHTGYLCVYTASNATKFYLDNVYAGNEILDVAAPVLLAATATSATAVDVLFNEALAQAPAESISNYVLSPAVPIASVTLDAANNALVHLTTANSLTNGTNYTLSVSNIADLSGNDSTLQSAAFTYLVPEVPLPGDVLINEFFCDPSPVVGLPELEFIEVFNNSTKYFDLTDWKIGDASADGTISAGTLAPGEYRVLCATSSTTEYPGSSAVTSFPSLNNSGDDIVLKDASGNVIDKISYTDEWYNDPDRNDGGYTIERINPADPCPGKDNWRASTAASGGTPGVENSVNDLTPDTDSPSLVELIALAPNFLTLVFDEPMDSLSLMNAGISVVSPPFTEQDRYVTNQYPQEFTVAFMENFVPSQEYTLTLTNAKDCWQNPLGAVRAFTLPEEPATGDIVINEILSDPLTGASDYIELYNNSDKTINLNGLQIANFDNDTISSIKQIPENLLLHANSYMLITTDLNSVLANYPMAVAANCYEIASLPTYANDEGTVIILFNNEMLDRVDYTSDWHFQLLDDTDGKALERLDPAGMSNDGSNWHTAAESVAFGTPGTKNSQFYPAIQNGDFSYSSDVISPDNDGYQDVLQINYQLAAPSSVGTFTIYDDQGREVIRLMQSELLGTKGSFTWNGLTNDQSKAGIGVYVGVFEVYNLDDGLTYVKRKAFTVAGKL